MRLTGYNADAEDAVEKEDGEEELEGKGPGDVQVSQRLLDEHQVHRDHVHHVAVYV